MKWRYVAPLSLLGFGAGLAIVTPLSSIIIVPDNESVNNPILEFVGMCLVSPIFETLALWMFVTVFEKIFPLRVSAIAAALVLAACHALVWTYWPLVVAPILIASSVPFMFENTGGTMRAAQSFLIHALNNFMAWSMAYLFLIE